MFKAFEKAFHYLQEHVEGAVTMPTVVMLGHLECSTAVLLVFDITCAAAQSDLQGLALASPLFTPGGSLPVAHGDILALTFLHDVLCRDIPT